VPKKDDPKAVVGESADKAPGAVFVNYFSNHMSVRNFFSQEPEAVQWQGMCSD
jgi:hypothetical protein